MTAKRAMLFQVPLTFAYKIILNQNLLSDLTNVFLRLELPKLPPKAFLCSSCPVQASRTCHRSSDVGQRGGILLAIRHVGHWQVRWRKNISRRFNVVLEFFESTCTAQRSFNLLDAVQSICVDDVALIFFWIAVEGNDVKLIWGLSIGIFHRWPISRTNTG